MKSLISLQDLSYSYCGSSTRALNNISLKINSGDLIGLVGPNGAGKTTLMNIFSSLIIPCGGTIQFEESNPKSWIALAPQEIAFYPTLTSEENLRFFAELGGVSSSLIQERISWCLEFVGLTGQRKAQPTSFSGGMKRRLNIAIALVTRPRFLLLDEPTVGVDPHSRYLILKALKTLNTTGTAILYSSHYMEEVEKFCSSLVLLDHGVVKYSGSMEDFIKSSANKATLEERFIEWTGTETRDL